MTIVLRNCFDLFGGDRIRNNFESRRRALLEDVASMPESWASGKTEDYITSHIVSCHTYPRATVGEVHIDRTEAIDTGIAVQVELPVSGDTSLLSLKPQVSAPIAPLPGRLIQNVIVFATSAQDGEGLRSRIDSWANEVKRIAEQLDFEAATCNAELEKHGRSAVQARLKAFAESRAIADSLPYPRKAHDDSDDDMMILQKRSPRKLHESDTAIPNRGGDTNGMTVPNNRLFSGASLDSLFAVLESKLEKEIDSLELSDLSESESKLLEKQLEDKYALKMPVLNKSEIHRSAESDCKVDVRGDPTRSVSDRSRPCMMAGKRAVIGIPFAGDVRLLFQNPKAPNAISAMATVEENTLDLEYTRPLPIDTGLLERDIQNDIQAVEANLTFLQSPVERFNRDLTNLIKQKFVERKKTIEDAKNALNGLSIPMKVREQKPTPTTKDKTQAKPKKSSPSMTLSEEGLYEYDVFICHSSEDKESVAKPLATQLKAHGVRVWYDEFALTIGDSLRQKIDEGLLKSEYGIVILSPSFFDKSWTKHELDGLTEKEMRNGKKVILPVWHKVTHDDVFQFSPTLANKVAGKTADMDKLLNDLLGIFGKTRLPSHAYYDVPGSYYS